MATPKAFDQKMLDQLQKDVLIQSRDTFDMVYGGGSIKRHNSGLKTPTKEQTRFRDFAEKYVIARAASLNTTQDIWNATLDAKQAYRMIIGQTDTLAPPDAPEAPEAPLSATRQLIDEFDRYQFHSVWETMKKGDSTRGKGSKKGR